ncbi:MAG TPA: hypothetical protein V6D47_08255, partial [Oscillatoriaceae cyanobacterium]
EESRAPGTLVLHVTGMDHCRWHLGTPHDLAVEAPKLRRLVVLLWPFKASELSHEPEADFVILTNDVEDDFN